MVQEHVQFNLGSAYKQKDNLNSLTTNQAIIWKVVEINKHDYPSQAVSVIGFNCFSYLHLLYRRLLRQRTISICKSHDHGTPSKFKLRQGTYPYAYDLYG
jgi:hypothetical protein